MTDDELRRERLYQKTMSVIRAMLEKGLISMEEYGDADARMEAKYCPKYGSILANIDLI